MRLQSSIKGGDCQELTKMGKSGAKTKKKKKRKRRKKENGGAQEVLGVGAGVPGCGQAKTPVQGAGTLEQKLLKRGFLNAARETRKSLRGYIQA